MANTDIASVQQPVRDKGDIVVVLIPFVAVALYITGLIIGGWKAGGATNLIGVVIGLWFIFGVLRFCALGRRSAQAAHGVVQSANTFADPGAEPSVKDTAQPVAPLARADDDAFGPPDAGAVSE